MKHAYAGMKCLAAALLALSRAADAEEYQFQVDQAASGGSSQLHVSAATSGTLIGNYDATLNPTGTRTKPVSSVFSSGPAAGENVAVPVTKLNPDAKGSLALTPTGSFRLSFDIAGGSVSLTAFSTDLLGGNSASVPVTADISFNQFRTANPTNWYPATSTNQALGDALVSQLSAVQVPGSVAGTLTPLGGNQYSFAVTPMVVIDAKVDFQGSPLDVPSSPLPFPLVGNVTLSGNSATLTESAPINMTDSSTPNQAMTPFAYDLPGTPAPLGSGLPSHLIFNLTLATTQTTVQGTQSLHAEGVIIYPNWTGGDARSSAWSSAANWSATVPNARDAVALFSSPAVPRNVTVDVPVTVGSIVFSSVQPYTLSGTHSITFSSSGTAALTAGGSAAHTIDAPLVAQSNLDIDIAPGSSLSAPQGLTISAGVTVDKTGGAGDLHLGPVTMQDASSTLSIMAGHAALAHLASGQLEIGPGASVLLGAAATPSTLDGLSLQGTGTLELSSDLVLNYAGVSPYAGFAELVHGHAIFTSGGAVALVDNATLHITDWQGTTISDGVHFDQLLLAITTPGDTNLDGQTTPADYVNIIDNMGKSGASWFDGDLNGDGVVGSADYAIVTQNLGLGAPGGAAAVSSSAVPEPGTLGLAALATMGWMRRRRVGELGNFDF